MKMTLVAVVLVVAGTAFGQQSATPASTPAPATAPQGQPAAAPQKKEIKDPAEYNAYVNAVQQADPAAKISGLEAFLVQYPNSVMKPDALEILMSSYQKTGDAAKMSDAANRLLQADPNNVRALALLAYGSRSAQKWPDARQYAERGLAALPSMTKPDGVSDADFQKQKTELGGLLNSVAGFSALQMKDSATAQKDLLAAVTANPTNLEDVYPLALSYLTANPPDTVNGLFFIARAANLAQGAGQTQITNYGKSVYTKYHGSDQGWDDVLAAAKANPLPPANFTVAKYVPPTPAEQCTDLLKTKAPKDMSFAEWELCLSKGKPEDSDKVWSAIKGVPLQMEAQVISADPNTVQLAGSSDDIDAKRADITLTMDGPIPAKLMPKEGGPLDFQGTPVSFTPDPFVVTMEKGALLTKAGPPTHKAPVHHRPASN
jgi:tetratricopeptide (TPR) repeat protein